MKTCHQIQSELVEALYGDLDEIRQQGFDTHLSVCAECAAQFASLRSTLETMDRRDVAEPEPRFWDTFAERIKTRVADRKQPSGDRVPDSQPGQVRGTIERRSGIGLPHWAGRMAAAIAILVVGITMGRLSPGPAPSDIVGADATQTAAAGTSAGALSQRVNRYMERCRMLLLGIVNLDPAADGFESFDLEPHQHFSQQLAQEAHVLHRDLTGVGERRLARLVLELQDILLQIASLDTPERVEGLRVVRENVQRSALLFKIHLESTRRTTPSGDSAQPDSSEAPGTL